VLDHIFIPKQMAQQRAYYQSVRSSMETGFYPQLALHCSRDRLARDFLNSLVAAQSDDENVFGALVLVKPIHVHFENEEGIDAGGVKREALTLACKELFKKEYSMFLYDEGDTRAFFNPLCSVFDSQAEMLREYELLGQVLALSLLNNVLLSALPLAPIVYRKLLGLPVSFSDLATSFPQLHQSLLAILNYEQDDLADALSLTFSVEQHQFGVCKEFELKTHGKYIAVTQSNKHEYVTLMTEFTCNLSVAMHFQAFAQGFWSILPQALIQSHLQPSDFETLMRGEQGVIDLSKLEHSNKTKYLGFHSRSSHSAYDHVIPTSEKPKLPLIRHLWSVLHSLSSEEKRAFLSFVTGSSSIPIGGLETMNFQISSGGPDANALPQAKTCFSTLVLPHYKSKAQLKAKLLKALEHATVGFALR